MIRQIKSQYGGDGGINSQNEGLEKMPKARNRVYRCVCVCVLMLWPLTQQKKTSIIIDDGQ